MKGIRNIQQITRAMKMVAAAKIKKAETRVKSARPYAEKIKEVVSSLQGAQTEETHPLLAPRVIHKAGVFLISADKGLCGAYNSNLFRICDSIISSRRSEGKEVVFFVAGQKGRRFYSRRGIPLSRFFELSPLPDFEEARQISLTLRDSFISGEIDSLSVVFTRYVSAMTQTAGTADLLPLVQPGADRKPADMIFEPSAARLLDRLLPLFVDVQVYTMLLEARASELGARLVAMGNATDNAEKLLGELTLKFYRARQEAITSEIIEVASGAEALRQ